MNELHEVARSAGEQLVEGLARAAFSTDGWADQDAGSAAVSQLMTICLDRLAATDCWGEANRVPSSVLWQVAGDVLSVGQLQHQARFKPRGYAGDFEMLQKIIDRTLCSHPLGRAFDNFFQEQAAPQAVRARTRFVADRIIHLSQNSQHDKLHICSIGCGPAMDIELACRELARGEKARIVVTLLDIDPDALSYAKQRLAPLLADEQLRLHRENLFRIPRLKRIVSVLENADFISCTGLFDYLPNLDAVAMLRCFWNQLATNGEMVVFNFAPSNPSRAFMEWIGNWYLIYRDEEMMKGLVHEALGPSLSVRIARESSQASLYASCRKTQPPTQQ